MKPGHVNVDARTRVMLDEQGVQRVTAMLHPRLGDCLTCFRPLRSDPLSLVVDQPGSDVGWAQLHHARCREPGWNDSSPVVLGADDTDTYAFGNWVVGDGADHFPVLMLNPSLESVLLERVNGVWRPTLPEMFARHGMQRFELDRDYPPAAGITVHVGPSSVTQISVGDEFTYPITDRTCPPSLVALLHERTSVILMVSHAADPGDIVTMEQIRDVTNDPVTLMGFARVVRAQE